MINTEYTKEFFFDIDAYLIEWYPKMNQATRRTICFQSLEYLTSDDLEAVVDVVVDDFAKDKQGLTKKEVEEEDAESSDWTSRQVAKCAAESHRRAS